MQFIELRKDLPIMDGFEFRQNQLSRPEIKDIPVIVMSADGHVEEKQSRTQAIGYLRKPFNIASLLSAVQKHSN